MSAFQTRWQANWLENRAVTKALLRPLALAALITLLAGCASAVDEPIASPEPASPTPEPKVFVAAPLTGFAFEEGSEQSKTFSLPAVSCKIDNVYAARPQFNLNKADLVFVQMVEGGVTRLVGVWQSQPVDAVGPVRSVRPMDADTVAPLGGIFCFSGGQLPFVQAVEKTGVYMASETTEQDSDKGSFSRSSAKPAPHNVIVDMALLQSQHLDKAAPKQVFEFVSFNAETESYEQASTATGQPTIHVTIKYPGAASFWEQDGNGYWVREQDGSKHIDAATDEQLRAKNVIVLKVKIDTSFRDRRYGYIPRTVLIDSGIAWVFADGKRVKGSWTKDTQDGPIRLVDQAGNPIKLAPGNSWVELMPTNGTITMKSPEVSPSPSP